MADELKRHIEQLEATKLPGGSFAQPKGAPRTTAPSAMQGNLETEQGELAARALRAMEALELRAKTLEHENEALRHAQAALEVSRSRYFDIFTAIPAACLSFDQEGNVREANAAAATLFEKRTDELAMQKLDAVLGCPGDPRVGLYVRQSFSEPARQATLKIEMKPPSGRSRWLLVSSRPMGTRGTERIAVLVEVDEERLGDSMMRVLDQIGLQMAPMTAPSALANQLVTLAVPVLGDLCVVTLDGREGSPEYTATAHVEPGNQALLETLGARFWALPGVRSAAQRARAKRTPVLETQFRATDPRMLAFEFQDLLDVRQIGIRSLLLVPLVGRGDVLGMIALGATAERAPYREEDLPVVADIGRRAALAIDNGLLFRELYEMNLTKDRFIAMLSHELRTPLTPVLAAVSALLGNGDRSVRNVRSTLEMIQRNVELEARIIDDLLDLSRVEHGQFHLNLESVDAHATIGLAVEICRREATEKGIALTFHLAAQEHHVRADPARLQQIIWNLVKNAVKFTPSDGSIEVRTGTEDGVLWVEVADTGAGIDGSDISRIFEAFTRASGPAIRQGGGLGLGLTISRTLAQAHGGKLEAISEGLGRGATFRLELPLTPPPVAASSPPQRAETTDASSAERVKTILLVEDDPDTLEVLSQLLEDTGYRVEKADSVARALDRASDRSFDLLISDIGLPDGSGLDLMRELRGRVGDLKAIALSGYGTDNDVARAHHVGFAAHLTKPVSVTKLVAMVRQLTNGG
jgi:PAS domain S-box-containing protein